MPPVVGASAIQGCERRRSRFDAAAHAHALWRMRRRGPRQKQQFLEALGSASSARRPSFDANLPCFGANNYGYWQVGRGVSGFAAVRVGRSQMSGSFGGLVPWLVIALLVVLVAAAGAIFLVRRLGAG